MNKIDGLINLFELGSVNEHGCIPFGLIPEDRDIILEALQAMKAKQPDTIHDLVKRLRTKAHMIASGEKIAWGSDSELMEEAADMLETVSKNPAPNLTQDDPCVREALSALCKLRNTADQFAKDANITSDYETRVLVNIDLWKNTISTALLAKQPDMERLKRVEDVLQEIDEYLSSNELNSIGSGSILHKRIKNLI